MKFKRLVVPIVILAGSFLVSSSRWDEDPDKQKLQMTLILQTLLYNHYNPAAMDDAFSRKVFDLYLDQLDNNKRLFTQADSISFAEYKDKLDDELNATSVAFFEKVNTVYEQRLQAVSGLVKANLAQPIDFTLEEKIQLDPKKRTFPKDDAELKEVWRKTLKYWVMVYLQNKLDAQESALARKDTSVKTKTYEVLEQESRLKVQKEMEDMFKRLQRETKEERFAEYLNAIVHAYDPHSDFFPPKDKENFDIQFSGKLEGIGATLQEKEGYIKVSAIVPGSPSYKQGELKAEDLILKVAQGDEEPVDIVDMRLDNAVKLIRGKKGTTVRLTVKKPDGTIKVISIVRDVVIMEETYAKSVLIKDTRNNQRIGYIHLPSFYADFSGKNGRNCAEDIRNELNKMNQDKVDGIVLDLRNNGGGSLQDVVKMGGYFIPQGPIVQVKSREMMPYVLKDEDPEVVYNGPLVVLVNSFSASASEILAAALQDYKRALIIGTPSTFGKGTVQRFFELSQMVKTNFDPGTLKATTQKFYRINGGSTQLNGVVPDIILPDLYQDLDIGEREMDYPLPWDKISSVKYAAWSGKPIKLKEVQAKSKARVGASEAYQRISANAAYLKSRQQNTLSSLHLKTYQTEQQAHKKEEEKFKKEEKELSDWQFEPLQADAPALSDSVKSARHKTFTSTLKKDVTLFEAVQVIKDIRK